MEPSSDNVRTTQDLEAYLIKLLYETRGIEYKNQRNDRSQSIPETLKTVAESLRQQVCTAEADAIDQVYIKTTWSPNFGGLGISEATVPSQEQYDEVIFQCNAWLESIRSRETAQNYLTTRPSRLDNARPMTLAQKIFTQHALSGVGEDGALALGDVCRVGVDWIIASELSWAAMAETYSEMGNPGIWRNDRLWIAGDHVVHPTLVNDPKMKTYIETAEKAKRDLQMTEYQGMNYTIMHTEFVRERAQPGMLVFGSDSHTSSAGAVGCLSIGCGTSDVMMTLSLGETWIKVPESILIEFVGEPAFGMSGKDVILHILKELKRNTVAAERIVEFAGPGIKHLSCDARFAICNMCAEFGAITGVFVPDEVTQTYVENRKRKVYRSDSLYFQPDQDAEYAGRYTIDLSAIEPTIAVYPNPDDVVPVSEMAGTPLNGVFIGACTTTEEELVLGALILKMGLAKGLPLAKGKRHYVPGSLPIVQKLQELGLLEIYQEAGFTRGPPGCSLCVGLSAEKAEEGETWLSSQNRNFRNRMGKGSFGHLSSAIVCAASSFSLTITSPVELLKDIDVDFFNRYKGVVSESQSQVQYVEPQAPVIKQPSIPTLESSTALGKTFTGNDSVEEPDALTTIQSKIVTLPDFIDTDALAPGPTLTTCKTDEEFGQHVLEHTHPDFRAKVAHGQQVVVGGKAFGVGSSREVAVGALKGAGVKAVIARSYAFIYSRNQPSLGLLGIVMDNEDFYSAAQEGVKIEIDVPDRKIRVGTGSERKEFLFVLSDIEYQLTVNRGVSKAYQRFGKALWSKLIEKQDGQVAEDVQGQSHEPMLDSRLKW